MQAKPRVLVAAQPAAAVLVQAILSDAYDVTVVHTIGDGLSALKPGEQDGIALIICTIAFDDSRMLEFLTKVKQSAETSGISFVCCRLLPSVLPSDSMERLSAVCRHAGASDFVDFVLLDETHGAASAEAMFRDQIARHIAAFRRPFP